MGVARSGGDAYSGLEHRAVYDSRVLSFDERFPTDEMRILVKPHDADSVISKINDGHTVPIEEVYKVHFRTFRFNLSDRVIPIP